MATAAAKKDIYIEAIGRRKGAIARVRIMPSTKGEVLINDQKVSEYFPVERLQKTVYAPFYLLEKTDVATSVKVYGGGHTAQAEAIRLGIARALEKENPEVRTELKQAGFLKRDPRVKERKKFGLKKARRAPQWSKR